MFGIGFWELLIIAAVVLLIFGSRLPSVARSLGKSIPEFKRGMQESKDDAAAANRVEQK
jgi:sec-independent protein translocase protein TatA